MQTPLILELNDYSDPRLQTCFREYFAEIGEPLKENTRMFERMQQAVVDCGMHCHVVMDNDQIIGFIQFQQETLTHQMGFLTQNLGLIREFWVNPSYRKNGYGTALLNSAESYFKKTGVNKTILTYEENALAFYQKKGYTSDPSFEADNGQGVIAKIL